VVITKHGKPVAKLVPIRTEKDEIYNFLSGKGVVTGDCQFTCTFPRRVGQALGILVDTVVWPAFGQDRISSKAKTAIDAVRKDADGLAISDITLLELATLTSKGRVRLDISLESFFLQEVEFRFVVLPMTGRVCARAIGLPPFYPKDPADRIIGATALVEGLSLLTADREIHKSKVLRTIW
jgi:PIN domain nuclease of toxin-antitoxin system